MSGGPEATAAMRKLVGNWLKCELTGEKTRGREVGFCRNRDGEDIGKAIIEGFCARLPALFRTVCPV
jgi:endonuclease YncB( thermonuclease family)